MASAEPGLRQHRLTRPWDDGGTIEEGIDAAIIALTSLDEKRKVVTAGTPGRSMLSNSRIPCMHAGPFYAEPRRAAHPPGLDRVRRTSISCLST
jgi:hypothetical protein